MRWPHWIAGEDVGFCRRARAMGVTVWVDPTVRLVHHGRGAFAGALAEAMAVRGHYPSSFMGG